MDLNLLDDHGWVPSACTLPTEARPLRLAEFDDFFVHDVMGLTRLADGDLWFELRPGPATAQRAASLAARESDCCSFFVFSLKIAGEGVSLSVGAGGVHADVLAALGDRAERLMTGATT